MIIERAIKNQNREITYELITSKCKTDGAEGATVYGFKITSSDEVAYPDISPNKGFVEKLVSILNKEGVSINQLPYIVEDYIN